MMSNEDVTRRARLLYRAGLVICLVATILATLAAQNGDWLLWGLIGAIFLAAGWCVLLNIRLARQKRE